MMTLVDLLKRKSSPRRPGDAALTAEQADLLIPLIPGWARTGGEIHKTYTFRNFHETMAFVNALAFVAHSEDHHPELEVSYAKVRVRLSTHSVHGLSENDFITAAKIETLTSPAWTDVSAIKR
jgi:4a-hydroxytetrahydrobiopterin dehydratase